jgi:hypothetical protein
MNYNHPENPIRHSYPLASKDDGFSAALGLCLQTLPYILIRLGVLAAFTLAAIIWLALVGGVAYLFSGKDGGGGGGLVLFFIGFGLPAGIYYWLRKYALYLLKCGHVAVLTKLITDGKLPDGINQVSYGKNIVIERFAQTNVLFAVDSMVTGTARSFNRTLDWISSFIPFPGMENLMQIVHKIVDNTTTYIDETILSYNLARGDENVWRSSKDGLVYYAANVKPILKTAVISILIEYAITCVIFLLCLIPCYFVSLVLPAMVSGYAWLFAVFMTGCIRAAFLQPLFLTMIALTFHKTVQNQPINENYVETLSSVSNKFIELKEKAAAFTAGKSVEPAVVS